MGGGSSADLNSHRRSVPLHQAQTDSPQTHKIEVGRVKHSRALNVPTGPVSSTTSLSGPYPATVPSPGYPSCPMLVLPANCRAGLLPQDLGESVLGSVEVGSLSVSLLLRGCM